jgi:hypothetical protein
MIFEDDLSLELLPFWALPRTASSSIDEYASTLPSGWQCSQLGYSKFRGADGHPSYFPGVELKQAWKKGAEAGAFAYLLHRRGMEAILGTSLTDMKDRWVGSKCSQCSTSTVTGLQVQRVQPV